MQQQLCYIMKSICMPKLYLAIILSILIAPLTQAQNKPGEPLFTVKGTVVDSLSQKKVSYCTITLMDTLTKPITASYSDEKGDFRLEVTQAGTYLLQLSNLDYNTRVISLELADIKAVDLGAVELKQGMEMRVDEVEVAAKRELITAYPNKITYNMDADPQAATATTLEILRKVPMLSVDGEENVRLNGESNYKVLVDGRSSAMMSRNFREVIKSMPANSIKNIEIITNPSTRYDAEGLGGIINIVTKRDIPRGIKGSVNMGTTTTGTVTGGGYLTGRVGKFSASTNVSLGALKVLGGKSYGEIENMASSNNRYSQSAGESGRTANNYTNISLEMSYEIDTMNLITLSGWSYLNNYNAHTFNNTKYWNEERILTQEYNNSRDNSGRVGTLSGSIDYQHSFKKPDRILTISYYIDNTPSSTIFDAMINGLIDYDTYRQYSNNRAHETEHTAQVDFFDPTSEMHQYEAGLKYILRQNRSNTEVKLYDESLEDWTDHSEGVNDIDYDQHIGSLYAGYTFNYKQFSAEAGVRGELSVNRGVSKIAGENIPFNQTPEFKVTPYINLSQALKEGQSITLSYTQRIQRPGINYLNPYVNDADPMNISTGNPNLKSVTLNQISTKYSKSTQKWNLFADFTLSMANNSVERISRINESGVKFTTFDNIGINNKYRLTASYSYRLGSKLSLYLNGNVSYVDIRSKAEELSNSGFIYQATLGGVVQLWTNCNFNFNAGTYSANINLQGKGSATYNHSLGLSQQLLKQSLTISISANNPFLRYRTITDTLFDNNFNSSFDYRYQISQYSLNLRYNFGSNKTQMKRTDRTIQNDDKLK